MVRSVVEIDRAAEGTFAVVVVDLPGVAARKHHERAVVRGHVVEQDPHGEDALVGVRVEGPILVPLDCSPVARGFQVDLSTGTKPDVLADQRLQDLHDARMGR